MLLLKVALLLFKGDLLLFKVALLLLKVARLLLKVALLLFKVDLLSCSERAQRSLDAETRRSGPIWASRSSVGRSIRRFTSLAGPTLDRDRPPGRVRRAASRPGLGEFVLPGPATVVAEHGPLGLEHADD